MIPAKAAVQAAIDALNDLGVPYMLVGSFSSNHYGIPRSTQDADFVVQLQDTTVQQIVTRLGDGFRLDPQIRFETITGTTRYIIETPAGPFKIELFELSDDPHNQERFRRRCAADYMDRRVFVPAVEDVIVTKLRWSKQGQRRKDVDDVRDILSVQDQAAIDWDYVHHWCDQHGTRATLDRIRAALPPI